jgi:hypothetical protein
MQNGTQGFSGKIIRKHKYWQKIKNFIFIEIFYAKLTPVY